MRILVTGSAGFIGYHLCKVLLKEGHEIIGIDNLNDYYDSSLKLGRLKSTGITGLTGYNETVTSTTSDYVFIKLSLEDKDGLHKLFEKYKFEVVVNLAAQAGVRYSLTNPDSYVNSNITGFLNILEGCRAYPVKHLVYASTSSVYGSNTSMPFLTTHSANHPVSFYAATKKANELMAHSYSHLFNIPTTGLRFFTVYGPWGRPDMALFLFTKAILNNEPIQVFNHGDMYRDFTYVEDLVNGIAGIIRFPPTGNPLWDGNNPDPSSSKAPYRIFNIGNNNPSSLLEFIEALEDELGIKAHKIMLPLQPGDVKSTHADISEFSSLTNYAPQFSVREGVKHFVKWYKEYYNI